MAGVAFNDSQVSGSTASGYVTYDIERLQSGSCNSWDEDGWCDGWDPDYWVSDGSGSTNAVIEPSKVTATPSKVFVNGKAIAKVGDSVSESWVASPSVPSSSSTRRYLNINPSESGSGTGKVSTGSSKVFVGGKQVAFIGSKVDTHLQTASNITSGSTNVFVN